MELAARLLHAYRQGACMDHSADTTPAFNLHAYLASFCALAIELYPEQDWATVEPKLERSWHRHRGNDRCRWADVRDAAQARWLARNDLRS